MQTANVLFGGTRNPPFVTVKMLTSTGCEYLFSFSLARYKNISVFYFSIFTLQMDTIKQRLGVIHRRTRAESQGKAHEEEK